MMRKAWCAVILLVWLAWPTPAHAQITPTYTFVIDTVINPDEVNANFALLANACNRTGCTMTGPMTAQGIVPDGNNTRALGSSSARWSTIYGVAGDFSGTLTTATLVPTTVTCTGCITSTNVLNGTLLDADINTSAAIALSKLATTGTFSATSVSDSVGSMATLRGGGIGLPSQAQYDLMYAASGSAWTRLANSATTGHVLTATSGGAPSWEAPLAGAFELIGYGSTSGTTVGPTSTNSIVVSGLTNNDSLLVIGTMSSGAGGQYDTIKIYNSTAGVSLATMTGTNVNPLTFAAIITRMASTGSGNPPTYTNYGYGFKVENGTPGFFNGPGGAFTWTDTWTINLRYENFTNFATDTIYINFAVYKIAGQ